MPSSQQLPRCTAGTTAPQCSVLQTELIGVYCSGYPPLGGECRYSDTRVGSLQEPKRGCGGGWSSRQAPPHFFRVGHHRIGDRRRRPSPSVSRAAAYSRRKPTCDSSHLPLIGSSVSNGCPLCPAAAPADSADTPSAAPACPQPSAPAGESTGRLPGVAGHPGRAGADACAIEGGTLPILARGPEGMGEAKRPTSEPPCSLPRTPPEPCFPALFAS
jgi:hypothetical protein